LLKIGLLGCYAVSIGTETLQESLKKAQKHRRRLLQPLIVDIIKYWALTSKLTGLRVL